MSRVIQYRSLITQVISRSTVCARQSHSLTAFVIKRESDTKFNVREISGHHTPIPERCKKLHLLLPRTNFHTSAIAQSEEPIQSATGEKPEDKESSHSHREESENCHEENTRDDFEGIPDIASADDSIITRLRRLSMTYAEDYQLSPVAQAKAREMQKVRKETIKRGEQWKWDQKNIRPSGPPIPSQYNRGHSWDDDDERRARGRFRYDEVDGFRQERRWSRDDNFGQERRWRRDDDFDQERRWRRDDDFDQERRWQRDDDFGQERKWSRANDDDGYMRSSNSSQMNPRENEDFDKDDPDDYELEMQKLRNKLKEQKVKKVAPTEKRTAENDELVERSSKNIRTAALHNELSDSTEQPASTRTLRVENRGYTSVSDDYAPDHRVNFSMAAEDPDTFGNLSFSSSNIVKDNMSEQIRKELLEEEKTLSAVEEEEEEDDIRFIPPHGEKWTTDKLIAKVRALLKEKKLKEAVDTYLGVLKQGGFHFNEDHIRHHFNVLINECAEVGYVDMAFRLFNLMKKRGHRERPRTISSLLNACANSPWDKERNLDRIDKLLISVKDRGIDLNAIHYNTLIKEMRPKFCDVVCLTLAYGRLGETVRAFHVVDKMLEDAQLTPTTSTFNMLMQACITDTKNGFRYTLITWRKLLSMGKMRPDIYSYNLLLRAVRDCGIEVNLKNIDLTAIEDGATRGYIESSSFPLLPPSMTEEDKDRIFNFLISEKSTTEEGQLIVNNFENTNTVADVKAFVKALDFGVNRMAVLGGVRGILSQMVRHKVAPNLKTLTAMLEVSKREEIFDVLQLLSTYKIKPDVSFFNIAIKQCYEVNAPEIAKNILKLMNGVYNLTPNIATWGVLALGCRTWTEAKNLLAEMDNTKFTPNIAVLSCLLVSATKQFDPRYVLHLLEETRMKDIPVHEKYIRTVDDFIKHTQQYLVSHEMGKHVESKKFNQAVEANASFGEHFALLKMRYGTWIDSVDVKVDPENPWKDEFEYFRVHKRHRSHKTEDDRSELLVNAAVENKV